MKPAKATAFVWAAAAAMVGCEAGSHGQSEGAGIDVGGMEQAQVSADAATSLPRPSTPDVPTLAEQRRAAISRLATIDAKWQQEARDEAWAKEVESKVALVLAQKRYSGTVPVRTECRAISCRVEVSHRDSTSAQAFEWIGKDMQMDYYLQKDGGRTVVYFTRAGYQDRDVISQTIREEVAKSQL